MRDVPHACAHEFLLGGTVSALEGIILVIKSVRCSPEGVLVGQALDHPADQSAWDLGEGVVCLAANVELASREAVGSETGQRLAD